MATKTILKDTDYGFQFGPVEVTRIHSDDDNGWVVLDVKSAKQNIQIRVTKTGKIRMHTFGQEIDFPRKEQ